MKTFRLTVNDVNKHKDNILYMLDESYRINFPGDKICQEDIYYRLEVMKSYIEKNEAILFGVSNESNNDLIGFIWFFEKPNINTIHVNSFVVKSEYRKKGIGRILWNELEKYAVKKAIRSIELLVTKSNKTAVEFYKHKDFEIERYVMRKRL